MQFLKWATKMGYFYIESLLIYLLYLYYFNIVIIISL